MMNFMNCTIKLKATTPDGDLILGVESSRYGRQIGCVDRFELQSIAPNRHILQRIALQSVRIWHPVPSWMTPVQAFHAFDSTSRS